MMTIVHDMAMMNAERQFGIITGKKTKSTEKLSSGYKINRAADDAAGLSISEKMRRQIRGLSMGRSCLNNGISWVQIGDGAMSEMHDMIHRIRELAVKASNETWSDEDRMMMNAEISQLKKQINSISKDTVFNTKPVFDNSNIQMNIFGTPEDMNIFNATYDDQTGDVTYGGFVFRGTRISWDEVSPNMVKTDPNTGKQVFVKGDYTWNDATTGYSLQFSCKDGAEVPEITRKIKVSANAGGISIDGKQYGWEDIFDEDGNPMKQESYHGGAWGIDYEGAVISFWFPDEIVDFSELVDALNSLNGFMRYSIEETYTGSKNEKAVDATIEPNLRISNTLAAQLMTNHLSYTVRADATGIWLEDEAGAAVNGSQKSWNDMGISQWNTGRDIQKTIVYEYDDNEGTNDTYLSFDFTLSDVTSLDSVVDGLDGMVISGNQIITSYKTNLNIAPDTHIVKATATVHNSVTFQDEKALGRDFDTQKIVDVANADVEYDAASQGTKVSLGNDVIVFEGDSKTVEKNMEGDLNTYLNLVLRRKQQLALAGADPQADLGKLGTVSLTELVGAGKITTSGYFDSVITINGTMNLSDGDGSAANSGTVAHPGIVGSPYASAFIDFSGFGTSYQMEELVGLGFNSTCKTCSNHYSIVFSDGASGSVTPEGYEYSMRNQGDNYTLFIDVNSMKAQGVNNGTKLADALVSITSECFDFHYTQYASQNGVLYVYDDRSQNVGTRSATFDTAPFQAINMDEFTFQLSTDDGRNMSLTYVYDYADIADSLIVEMKQNNHGDYVLLDDGTYTKYNEKLHGNVDASKRFQMTTSYQKSSDGSAAANLKEVIDDYKAVAINTMLSNSNIQLDAMDYTKMRVGGNENMNVAVRSVFDTQIVETPYDESIRIRTSSQDGDYATIPRFPMNTVALNLYGANTRTYEDAQRTLEVTDYALEMVSRKRSTYGALQNRMEHLYNCNANIEENTTAAESRIRDTDIALEMIQYSNMNILQQAGQAMLSHGQQDRQYVLSLLQ